MALTVRTITNADDPLTAPDGTLLANKRVTWQLVDAAGDPCGAWDALTGDRIAPVKKTGTTDASGIIKTGVTDGVALWPNDRGTVPTFYECRVEGYTSMDFTAALPSGDGSPLPWADFSGNTSPISSDTYGYPLRLVAGATVPVTAVLTADGGIAGYTLVWQVTNSAGVMVEYPCIISDAPTGAYSCDLSALTAGNYIARLKYTNASAQIAYTTKWIISVAP